MKNEIGKGRIRGNQQHAHFLGFTDGHFILRFGGWKNFWHYIFIS